MCKTNKNPGLFAVVDGFLLYVQDKQNNSYMVYFFMDQPAVLCLSQYKFCSHVQEKQQMQYEILSKTST